MKRYTFELVINEGNDEFWEELNAQDSTGADKMKEIVADALWGVGFDVTGRDGTLVLTKYENINADV